MQAPLLWNFHDCHDTGLILPCSLALPALRALLPRILHMQNIPSGLEALHIPYSSLSHALHLPRICPSVERTREGVPQGAQASQINGSLPASVWSPYGHSCMRGPWLSMIATYAWECCSQTFEHPEHLKKITSKRMPADSMTSECSCTD